MHLYIKILLIYNKKIRILIYNVKRHNYLLKYIFIFLFIYLLIIFKKSKKQIEIELIKYIKNNQKNNLSKKNFKSELFSIKQYIKNITNNLNKIQNYNYENLKAKISIIVAVYNKEKYLKKLIISIQYQLLKEFEIILVDDCSSDNSTEIINEFQKKDKRIKLIKNKRNMGALYSRCNGAIKANGEYIIFVDPDDMVLREGLINSYNYIKLNNLDMVQFNSVFNYKGKIYINQRYYKYLNKIYQPILSYIFYYRFNSGFEGNTALWDKLINKNIAIKSINYLGNFIEEKIIKENDVVLLFALFRNSNSFQYIDEIGYYYCISNNDSISNKKYTPKLINQIIHGIFKNIKFLYEKTNTTYLDKYFCIFKLKQFYYRYKKYFRYLNETTDINTLLNELINSKFISSKNKIIIYQIKKEILKIY